MYVKYENNYDYYHVEEKAIEGLRIPDDSRIPGVPESIGNIARQCRLVRPFGAASSEILLLCRGHFRSDKVVVLRAQRSVSPPLYCAIQVIVPKKNGTLAIRNL